LNSFTFRLVDQNTATAGHNVCVNVNRLNWCDHCKMSMTVRYDVILWSGMRLKIKVGLNQSRTWSTTTVSVHNQYIKREKWHQHGVKTGGHSFIRDPLLRKVGGPLTPGPPRIAATVYAFFASLDRSWPLCEIWHRRTLPEKDRASAISSMLRTFGNIRPSGSRVCVQTDRHTTLVTMLRFLHRCNKRLQRLPKILINAFVIFVKVYYFNKRRMKCREKLCRIVRVKRSIRREAKQTDSDVEIYRKVNN